MHLSEVPLLSNKQLEILNFLYPDRQIEESDFQEIFDIKLRSNVIDILINAGLVSLSPMKKHGPTYIFLTEQGRAYLDNKLNNINREITKQKSDKKFQAFLVIISYLLGIVTNNIIAIINFIMSFLE